MRASILVAALALVLSGCSGWTDQASVGECAKPLDMTRGRVDMAEVDCSSQAAVYRLATREKRAMCPTGDYLEETTGRTKKTGKTRYCYVLNVKEGDCLKAVNQYFERVACGTGPTRKVTKVVSGKSDRNLCGADDPKTYSEPKTTLCITK